MNEELKKDCKELERSIITLLSEFHIKHDIEPVVKSQGVYIETRLSNNLIRFEVNVTLRP